MTLNYFFLTNISLERVYDFSGLSNSMHFRRELGHTNMTGRGGYVSCRVSVECGGEASPATNEEETKTDPQSQPLPYSHHQQYITSYYHLRKRHHNY